ncbi:hypothetical protein AVEN_105189-1 [Araneus ventricosus]|uniref:Uncharacterized protein n=1 Tax=Araneus ventricosus TaxID=182803 RepID=A0A4Y2PCF7_ARAVE|nr:hypothetical protein AVEN_105189-1 [Araneus ventricosus]
MIWKTCIPTQRALRKRRKEKPPLRAIANQHVLERENKARPLSVRKMEYEPTRFRSTAKDRLFGRKETCIPLRERSGLSIEVWREEKVSLLVPLCE